MQKKKRLLYRHCYMSYVAFLKATLYLIGLRKLKSLGGCNNVKLPNTFLYNAYTFCIPMNQFKFKLI